MNENKRSGTIGLDWLGIGWIEGSWVVEGIAVGSKNLA